MRLRRLETVCPYLKVVDHEYAKLLYSNFQPLCRVVPEMTYWTAVNMHELSDGTVFRITIPVGKSSVRDVFPSERPSGTVFPISFVSGVAFSTEDEIGAGGGCEEVGAGPLDLTAGVVVGGDEGLA
jgi:hypothetical protein